MGLNIAQMPADSALRRLHDRFVGGAVGYEIRSSGVSAADPAQMALTVAGKLYGVQYNLTVYRRRHHGNAFAVVAGAHR